MFFGKDPEKYNGDWVDPQTLYNYSDNLYKITVPILFIAGDEDPQDPADGIYSAFENVSSVDKEFYSFPEHSHMDLIMGDDASSLVFPKIDAFMKKVMDY
jgi:pimeloyl-ACP methyl ester carboxylesterase